MASGLAVVAPAIDGIRRIVADEREGLLYDPRDPLALALAIERLQDVETRRRLGEAARARAVNEFSWAGHCARLQGAIERALTRRGHARDTTS